MYVQVLVKQAPEFQGLLIHSFIHSNVLSFSGPVVWGMVMPSSMVHTTGLSQHSIEYSDLENDNETSSRRFRQFCPSQRFRSSVFQCYSLTLQQFWVHKSTFFESIVRQFASRSLTVIS
jgi:hypothetical protein